MYERGEREPNDEIKKRMAEFFNCSVDYLVGYSDFRGGQEMGMFTDLDKLDKRLKEIKDLARTTVDVLRDKKLTFSEYEYFKDMLGEQIGDCPIGKK